ncbi:MAG: transcription antitermination factor NusB [Acidobacteriota bacterium]
MSLRRRGREFALQMLFQVDMTDQKPQEVMPLFWQSHTVGDDVKQFAEDLFQGTVQIRPRLDTLLARTSAHWRLDRMPVVDRNLLRMALYEMLFQPDTPRVVVINEAIEIAKRFGSEDSGQFINGVLDQLRERIVGLDAPEMSEPVHMLEMLEHVLAGEAEERQ